MCSNLVLKSRFEVKFSLQVLILHVYKINCNQGLTFPSVVLIVRRELSRALSLAPANSGRLAGAAARGRRFHIARCYCEDTPLAK